LNDEATSRKQVLITITKKLNSMSPQGSQSNNEITIDWLLLKVSEAYIGRHGSWAFINYLIFN